MAGSVSDASVLKDTIRDIPDFPKKGIVFRDITPLLANPRTLGLVVDRIAGHYHNSGVELVVGAEARGFIFGPAVAYRLGAGFVPVPTAPVLPSADRKLHRAPTPRPAWFVARSRVIMEYGYAISKRDAL